MLDLKPSVVTALKSIDSGAEYELFCDSKTGLPRITYMQNVNTEILQGDTIGYSELSFTIKVQDNQISHMETQSGQIDTAMRTLGYRRTSCNEITFNHNVCKIMVYSGLAHETY